MASSAQQQVKLERLAKEIAPRVQQRMERFVKIVMGGGDLRKPVSDALDEVGGDPEHGLERLKFMLSMLAHCTRMDVRATDVVDPKGKVRIKTKADVKSLIMAKLFSAGGAPLQLVHPDSGTLRAVLNVLFVIALVGGVLFGGGLAAAGAILTIVSPFFPSTNLDLRKIHDRVLFLGTILSAVLGAMVFYGAGGWAVHVPIQGIARDLRGCMKELMDVSEALAEIGAKPHDSPKQRREILRKCPGASMFAVLSPSGEPLTRGQMRAVMNKGNVGFFEMAYGGTGCFEEPRAGVTAMVLGAPARLLSALLG